MAVWNILTQVLQRWKFGLVIFGLALFILIILISQNSTIVRAVQVYNDYGLEGVYRKAKIRVVPDNPHVEWTLSSPESQGIQASKLQNLTLQLAEKDTEAFLVVKDGYLIHEWYDKSHDSDSLFTTAALAKPTVGSMTVMAAMDGNRIHLSDPAWKYIPAWQDDPQKAKITISDLGAHRSGLEDVAFQDDVKPEWKLDYYKNPGLRFSMALSTAQLLFEPGARTEYSGVGYYVLAFAIARSMQDSASPDVQEFLKTRIMEPLQIPSGAWSMSYGDYYQVDGLRLYAIGSGSKMTPRAIARIGQLMLNEGEWNGQQIVSPQTVNAVLGRVDSAGNAAPGPASIGWRTNLDGHLPSLPKDAFWGFGNNDQVLLVVPSRNLVMVRMGGAISPDPRIRFDREEVLEEHLFKPLLAATEETVVREPMGAE